MSTIDNFATAYVRIHDAATALESLHGYRTGAEVSAVVSLALSNSRGALEHLRRIVSEPRTITISRADGATTVINLGAPP